MILFHMPDYARQNYKEGIDMLPDLEVDVFAEDLQELSLEIAWEQGMDDWWAAFTADDYV